MRRRMYRVQRLATAALILLAPAAWMQMHAQTTEPGKTPRLQEHPVEELRRTQPADGEHYELGAGDELKLTVLGRPELSGTQVLGPDARIAVPVAGSVPVGGLSSEAAADAVAKALEASFPHVFAQRAYRLCGARTFMGPDIRRRNE